MTALAGTRRLTRFTLRRDRVRLTVWVLAIGLTVMASVASVGETYPTAADRQARATLMEGNAAAKFFVGPGYGIDDYTFGAMTANELLPLTTLVVALMNIFLVVRHTRAEEEDGRAELVRAGSVGRHAIATATLLELALGNVALTLLLTFGLPASLGELDTTGSLAFAAANLGVGAVFAALALLVAQLTVTARAALGLSSAAMAVLWVVRAVADMGDTGLAWLTPFGWAFNMRAYVDERWWPLLLHAALTALLIAAALRIGARRDLGAGVIADRGGPARGTLHGPLGLALRLQRTSLVSWSVGLLAIAAVYGSLSNDAADLADDVGALQDYYSHVGAAAAVDQFVSFVVSFCAVIATAFVIQAAMRPHAEETAGRAEPVLATPIGRTRWLGSQLAIALGGALVVLLAIGIGMGVAWAISVGDAGKLLPTIGAALTYAPALWVFAGIATALFGWVPRATGATWAAFAAVAFLALLGPLLSLPDGVYKLSPFEHVAKLPAASLDVLPLLALCAIAAALVAAGLFGLRRRDVH